MQREPSWLGAIVTISNISARLDQLVSAEDSGRLDVLVEERSFLAHIIRKFQTNLLQCAPSQKMKYFVPTTVHADDDDEPVDADLQQRVKRVASRSLFKSRAEASGGLDLMPGTSVQKYHRIAAMRQLEWDLYEDRVRDLRRVFEETGNESVLDDIERLQRPTNGKKESVSCTRQVVVAAPPVPPRNVHPSPEKNPPLPPPPPPDDPAVVLTIKDEGFSRATFVMEERSCRLVLSNMWKRSLTHPDADMVARLWDRRCLDMELDRRESSRDAAAAVLQAGVYKDTLSKHRSIALAQNRRAQQRKDFREIRLDLEAKEHRARYLMNTDEVELFSLVYLNNIPDLLTLSYVEEGIRRVQLESTESFTRHRVLYAALHIVSNIEASTRLHGERAAELLRIERSDINRVALLYQRQVEEEELQTQRKETMRSVQDDEKREQLKLQMLYGVPDLTQSGSPVGQVKLRRDQELEVLAMKHTMQSIRETVARTSRKNQAANAMYISLDRRLFVGTPPKNPPPEPASTNTAPEPPSASSNAANELSEEDLAKYKQAFADFDVDGDGVISASDVAASLRSHGKEPTEAEVQAMVRRLDGGKDGAIDFKEFLHFAMKNS